MLSKRLLDWGYYFGGGFVGDFLGEFLERLTYLTGKGMLFACLWGKLSSLYLTIILAFSMASFFCVISSFLFWRNRFSAETSFILFS
jgi:hypothetical protein